MAETHFSHFQVLNVPRSLGIHRSPILNVSKVLGHLSERIPRGQATGHRKNPLSATNPRNRAQNGNVDSIPLSRLPPEIRFYIWQYLAFVPRIVPIKYQTSTLSYLPRLQTSIILRINRESRYEGLRIYGRLRLGPVIRTACYVNLKGDTVYLTTDLWEGWTGIHQDKAKNKSPRPRRASKHGKIDP
jgi:hypothetical protein